MECRDVRPLMARRTQLTAAERALLDAHARSCAACDDEMDDALARLLATSTLSLAIPPPDLHQAILRRLPVASPLEIAARAELRQRIYWSLGMIGAAVLLGLASAGLILL